MKPQNTQLKPADPQIASTSAGLLIRPNPYHAAVVALFFAGATLLGTSAAPAATITVINTNDSGPGSLRQALVEAKDGDTIDFDSSLNGHKITLTSGQLNVDKDITISGPGSVPTNLTVNGDLSTVRVFYISPRNRHHLRSHYHRSVTNSGGGIYNDGATLTVSNCSCQQEQLRRRHRQLWLQRRRDLTVNNCT